jgi:hypothetical protein
MAQAQHALLRGLTPKCMGGLYCMHAWSSGADAILSSLSLDPSVVLFRKATSCGETSLMMMLLKRNTPALFLRVVLSDL